MTVSSDAQVAAALNAMWPAGEIIYSEKHESAEAGMRAALAAAGARVSDYRTEAQRYYDALKVIARNYQTAEQLRRRAGQYGLNFEEEIAMAYENVQGAAEGAVHGRRRPK